MKRTLVLLLVLTACKKAAPADDAPAGRAPTATPSAPAAAKRTVWTAAWLAPQSGVAMGLYFTSAPKVDPIAAVDGVCKQAAARLAPPIERKIERPKLAELAPPDEEALKYFGRGLSDQQKKDVQHGPDPLKILVKGPAASAVETLRATTELVVCLQRAAGGLVWDDDTREMFTIEELKKRRLDPWPPGAPLDIVKQFTVHSYQDGELVRQVSLGLGKLGLPDLVANGVAPNLGPNMGSLINAVAEAMFEGAPISASGELELDLHKLRGARYQGLAKIADELKAPGKVTVRLAVGTREEGDASNRLVEIIFDVPGAGSPTEQQGAITAKLFGEVHDDIVREDHDDEVLKAMERARAGLRKLKPRFDKGLPVNESLVVKAPFRTDDDKGNEWMWIRVTQWKGERIKGTLDNDPELIKGLKIGAVVEAPVADIGDYALYDGEKLVDGYVLTKILAKRHGKTLP